ncbi:hypothetical protein B0T24DRAFT_597362 [Lasiosphaeria ovina]|uniref:Uncharacterized protein n=1 Tax=Lasiosphaeria ovina TaxID=92902 RepID=A0AAE0JXJ9_9PEZI|nr:hypothetical protein B0T24DRAFT_597362 [Lasiosphaeria ovina]
MASPEVDTLGLDPVEDKWLLKAARDFSNYFKKPNPVNEKVIKALWWGMVKEFESKPPELGENENFPSWVNNEFSANNIHVALYAEFKGVLGGNTAQELKLKKITEILGLPSWAILCLYFGSIILTSPSAALLLTNWLKNANDDNNDVHSSLQTVYKNLLEVYTGRLSVVGEKHTNQSHLVFARSDALHVFKACDFVKARLLSETHSSASASEHSKPEHKFKDIAQDSIFTGPATEAASDQARNKEPDSIPLPGFRDGRVIDPNHEKLSIDTRGTKAIDTSSRKRSRSSVSPPPVPCSTPDNSWNSPQDHLAGNHLNKKAKTVDRVALIDKSINDLRLHVPNMAPITCARVRHNQSRFDFNPRR